jgi:hypothetical protein
MKKKNLKLNFSKETIAKLQMKEINGGNAFISIFSCISGCRTCTPPDPEPDPCANSDCGETICKL